MKIIEYIRINNLENSFIIGYYGGTNFGDELILEVLMNVLKKERVSDVKIYYVDKKKYSTYHNDFGYDISDTRNKLVLLKKILQSKNIIIGGGGLWGCDSNLNIFLLSFYLTILRHILRKKIHFFGVGYYNSTNFLGRISGFLAGISANTIFARDLETFLNFKKYNNNTYLDTDIAFLIPKIPLIDYDKDAEKISEKLTLGEKKVVIGFRDFQSKYENNYINVITEIIKDNPQINFLLMFFQSKEFSDTTYKKIKDIENKHKNVKSYDFQLNPLAFFSAINNQSKNIKIIAPQYHIQLIGSLSNTPFLPISYDNKNLELFKQINVKSNMSIDNIQYEDLKKFIDEKY